MTPFQEDFLIDSALQTILDPVYQAEAGSLFRYLRTIHLYGGHVDAMWRRALSDMLERNDDYVEKLAALYVQHQGQAPRVSFPRGFSALHDNSASFVLGRMMLDKRRLVQAYTHAVGELNASGDRGVLRMIAFLHDAAAAHQSDRATLEAELHATT